MVRSPVCRAWDVGNAGSERRPAQTSSDTAPFLPERCLHPDQSHCLFSASAARLSAYENTLKTAVECVFAVLC